MTTAMTNYLEGALINHILRSSSYSAPGAIAVALCTSDPTDAATTLAANECPNSGSYARVTVGPGAGSWDAPSSGATANTSDITFTTATGSWGTVSHVAICDSATHNGGNCLFKGALAASKVVSGGDTMKFLAGELDLVLD